ncbi:MAG: phosphoglycolate phosphatase [Casimicrobiaceae bacterium]
MTATPAAGTIGRLPCPLSVGGVAIDLDGTLLDTLHDLAAGLNAFLVEWKYPPLPVTTIREYVGKGMDTLVRRALAKVRGSTPEAIEADEVARALACYQRHYAAILGQHTLIFDGVREGLARLHAMGLPLAVITNKASRFVRPHLEHAGIADYFRLVICAEDLPTRKPHPGPLVHVAQAFGLAPRHLLMIGDSGNDAEAARAAGCPVLIVPYGYSEGEPVEAIDADGIVPSLLVAAECVRPLAVSP